MIPQRDPTVEDLVRRLRSAFDPCTIYLFGSRATGTARPDSDFDVMVIVPESDESHFDRFKRARAALRDFQPSVDVLVYTAQEWQEHSGKRFSIARQVRDKGIRVHAA